MYLYLYNWIQFTYSSLNSYNNGHSPSHCKVVYMYIVQVLIINDRLTFLCLSVHDVQCQIIAQIHLFQWHYLLTEIRDGYLKTVECDFVIFQCSFELVANTRHGGGTRHTRTHTHTEGGARMREFRGGKRKGIFTVRIWMKRLWFLTTNTLWLCAVFKMAAQPKRHTQLTRSNKEFSQNCFWYLRVLKFFKLTEFIIICSVVYSTFLPAGLSSSSNKTKRGGRLWKVK